MTFWASTQKHYIAYIKGACDPETSNFGYISVTLGSGDACHTSTLNSTPASGLITEENDRKPHCPKNTGWYLVYLVTVLHPASIGLQTIHLPLINASGKLNEPSIFSVTELKGP